MSTSQTKKSLDVRTMRRYIVRTMSQEELEAAAIKSIGALLARQRWAKATPEQKAEAVRKMQAGRRKKARRNHK